jgi:hypothetical protein
MFESVPSVLISFTNTVPSIEIHSRLFSKNVERNRQLERYSLAEVERGRNQNDVERRETVNRGTRNRRMSPDFARR